MLIWVIVIAAALALGGWLVLRLDRGSGSHADQPSVTEGVRKSQGDGFGQGPSHY